MSETTQDYRGKKLTIRFDGAKCVHSRNCVLGLPAVFRANTDGPWIQPDAADPEELAALARACPSGAITYERHDGGAAERPPDVNVARVLENGPVAVHADIRLEGHEPMIRATLCRCGASNNKPFCDGAHTNAQFRATGAIVPDGDVGTLEARDGALEIKSAPNGPLLVHGNVEVVCGTGQTIKKTSKCALCRCGASSNKPFCDGTHAKIDFKG